MLAWSARDRYRCRYLPRKLDNTRTFGATALVNSAREDLAERVAQLIDGRGVEVAIEAIGLPKTIESAYAALARGGTAVVAGQVADGLKITIDPFVMSDPKLSLIGSSTPTADFPQLVEQYLHNRTDLDSLVTRVIDPQDINEAIDEMKRGIGIRSVIRY
ncbi:zinc-binding dehydrogenase [Nocardia barduliensis]|uniref:zinc-binding dehydrogenase n=1 Tax=Nocardia barduliensis TaxID=2736643 RepID=UPI001C2DA676|nr:zinc-binding dehydrogenase [Nocardia barduliensis]